MEVTISRAALSVRSALVVSVIVWGALVSVLGLRRPLGLQFLKDTLDAVHPLDVFVEKELQLGNTPQAES
jgi:hypothetical protein